MIIKDFKEDYLADVKDLLYRAFLNHPHGDPKKGVVEHLIVENLVQNNNAILPMVGVDNDKIIAFITYSKVEFDNDNQAWLGLAPVAVLPEYQGLGLGSQLITHSLNKVKQNYSGCVVMGEPKYYKRFGFNVVEGLFFAGVPQEYFLAQSFDDTIPQGQVYYNEAFYI